MQKRAEGDDRGLGRIKKKKMTVGLKGGSNERKKGRQKEEKIMKCFIFFYDEFDETLRLIKPKLKCSPDELYLLSLKGKGSITWYTLHI